MNLGSIPQTKMQLQNEKNWMHSGEFKVIYTIPLVPHFTSSEYNATLLTTALAIKKNTLSDLVNVFSVHLYRCILDLPSKVIFHLPDVYPFRHSLSNEGLLVVNTLNFTRKLLYYILILEKQFFWAHNYGFIHSPQLWKYHSTVFWLPLLLLMVSVYHSFVERSVFYLWVFPIFSLCLSCFAVMI